MSHDQSATQGRSTASTRGAAESAEEARTVVQQLRIVYRAMQEHSRWVEKQCGVSAAQLWALWELSNHPGQRVSELSQALSLHQSTTSNLLDKLEKKGLVERRRGGLDLRVVQVFLSASGEALVAQAPRPAQGAVAAALVRLPEPELTQLTRGLAGLINCMDGADRAAGLQPMTDGLWAAQDIFRLRRGDEDRE